MDENQALRQLDQAVKQLEAAADAVEAGIPLPDSIRIASINLTAAAAEEGMKMLAHRSLPDALKLLRKLVRELESRTPI